MNVIAQIFEIYHQKGASAYFGEPVTQLEHALQSALLAKQLNERPIMITAALLHDIGHLLHAFDENCADDNIDSRHEIIGGKFLADYFNPEVKHLVENHVQAKRYLAAINADYIKKLSDASLQSLKLQGGIMLKDEAEKFQNQPLFNDILKLRSFDEAAKVPDMSLPSIETFYAELSLSLR